MLGSSPLILAGAGYAVGEFIGSVVVMMLIFVFMQACVRLDEEPAGNPCTRSLSLALTAVIYMFVSKAVKVSDPGTGSQLGKFISELLVVAMIIAAFVYGIVGLRRVTPDMKKARSHAIWGVVISSIYLFLIIGIMALVLIVRPQLIRPV